MKHSLGFYRVETLYSTVVRFDGVRGIYSAFICIVFLFLHIRQNDFSLSSVVDRNIFSSRTTGIFVERRFCVPQISKLLGVGPRGLLVIRGTAERETAEREFFPFFLNKKTNNKQTVNIFHKIKGMHIFFILRGRSRAGCRVHFE